MEPGWPSTLGWRVWRPSVRSLTLLAGAAAMVGPCHRLPARKLPLPTSEMSRLWSIGDHHLSQVCSTLLARLAGPKKERGRDGLGAPRGRMTLAQTLEPDPDD